MARTFSFQSGFHCLLLLLVMAKESYTFVSSGTHDTTNITYSGVPQTSSRLAVTTPDYYWTDPALAITSTSVSVAMRITSKHRPTTATSLDPKSQATSSNVPEIPGLKTGAERKLGKKRDPKPGRGTMKSASRQDPTKKMVPGRVMKITKKPKKPRKSPKKSVITKKPKAGRKLKAHTKKAITKKPKKVRTKPTKRKKITVKPRPGKHVKKLKPKHSWKKRWKRPRPPKFVSDSQTWNDFLNAEDTFPPEFNTHSRNLSIMVLELTNLLDDGDVLDKIYVSYGVPYQNFSKPICGPNSKEARREIFRENLINIAQHNVEAERLGTWTEGVNPYTDMTVSEFAHGPPCSGVVSEPIRRSLVKPPAQIQRMEPMPRSFMSNPFYSPTDNNYGKECCHGDYFSQQRQNWVSRIRDCHNVWICSIYATVSAMETSHARLNNRKYPIQLSEQDVLDCCAYCQIWALNSSTRFVQTPATVLNHALFHGIGLRKFYKGGVEEVAYAKNKKNCNLHGERLFPQFYRTERHVSDKRLEQLVRKYSVIAYVSSDNFPSYNPNTKRLYDTKISQVLDVYCNIKRDHFINIVGYANFDKFQQQDSYWIIRNDVGPYWGIGGYAYIKKGPAARCRIGYSIVYLESEKNLRKVP